MGKITDALTEAPEDRKPIPGGWLDAEELGELTTAALNELHRVGGLKAESQASAMAAKRARAAGRPLAGASAAAAASAAGRLQHYEKRLAGLAEVVRVLQTLPAEGCQIIALPSESEGAEQEREHRAWLEAEARVLEAARDDNGWPVEAIAQRDALAEAHDGVVTAVRAVDEQTAALTLQGYATTGDAEVAVGPRFSFEWKVIDDE